MKKVLKDKITKGWEPNIVHIATNKAYIILKIACKDTIYWGMNDTKLKMIMTAINKQHGTRYVNLKLNLNKYLLNGATSKKE